MTCAGGARVAASDPELSPGAFITRLSTKEEPADEKRDSFRRIPAILLKVRCIPAAEGVLEDKT